MAHLNRLSIVALGLIVSLVPGAGGAEPTGPVAEAKVDLYGDPLPPGAMARLGTIRFRQSDPVMAMALSPDGKILASAGFRDLFLWEMPTGKQIARFPGVMYPVLLAFADSGKTLISVEQDHDWFSVRDEPIFVRCLDIDTGKQRHQFRVAEDTSELAMAATMDGRFLAVRDRTINSIRLWDLSARKEVGRFESKDDSGPIAISLDGKTLADSKDKIILWDVASGKQKRSLSYKIGPLTALDFSPDGKALVSSGYHHPPHIWDIETGKVLHTFRQVLFGDAVGFSSDGKYLATIHVGDPFTLQVWDFATRKTIRRWSVNSLERHAHMRSGTLLFTPDNKSLISVGDVYLIRLWDIPGNREIAATDPTSFPVQLVPSNDGRYLAACSLKHETWLWDLKSEKLVHTFKGASEEALAAFTPDGKRLAYAHKDHSIRLCAVPSGDETIAFEKQNSEVSALAFHLDGQTLFATYADLSFRAWDVATGKELRCHFLTKPTSKDLSSDSGVRPWHGFSPDARTLITVFDYEDEKYRLWTTSRGQRLYPSNKGIGNFRNLGAGTFAPDGRTLALWGYGDMLNIYELCTGKLRFSLLPALDDGSWSQGPPLAIAPDGRLLAARSQDGKFIELWDLATGQRVHRIKEVQGILCGLTFIGNGDLLASGGSDTTVLLWDISEVRRKAQLSPQALSAEDLDKLWEKLASDDPHAAIWKLTAGGASSVQFLKTKVRPVPEPSPQPLTQWLRELDDPDFAVREHAMRSLAKVGEVAEPTLRAALASKPSLELSRRIGTLLQKLEEDRHRELSPEQVRQQRALEVLENMNSPQARDLLTELSRGAAVAWLSRETEATLARLRYRERAFGMGTR